MIKTLLKTLRIPTNFIFGFLCACFLIATALNLALGWWNVKTINDGRRHMFITLRGEDKAIIERNGTAVDFVKTVAENQ